MSKSDDWARRNTDNPDIPKKWLRNEWYKKNRGATGDRMVNVKLTNNDKAYCDNYDQTFKEKDGSSIEHYDFDYQGDDTYLLKGTTFTFTHAERIEDSPKLIKKVKKALLTCENTSQPQCQVE